MDERQPELVRYTLLYAPNEPFIFIRYKKVSESAMGRDTERSNAESNGERVQEIFFN